MTKVLLQVPLHAKQLEIFKDPAKIRCVCAGRRFGKTRLMIWDALISALSFPGRVDPVSPEVVLLTEPTRVQASGVLWRPLVSLCESAAVRPLVSNVNRSEYRIDLKYGLPPILVAGTNDRDGDGIRGKRLYRYLGDEFQDVKAGVLDTIILPAMADTPNSRGLLTFTPKGKLNHTYALSQRVESEPETYSYWHARTLDNPWVLPSEVERARLSLPPRIFRQEFEASWEDFEGKVYSELSSDNLIDGVLPDCERYFMGIDWGEAYPAVLVLGKIGEDWYFIEGWQGNYQSGGSAAIPYPTFEAEILRLAKTYRVDGCYCDPSRPASILTLRTLGKDHGISGLQRAVGGYNRIADGISQVHSLIYQRRLRFADQPQNERCPDRIYGREAMLLMESYQYEVDKSGQVTDVPADGIESHICDSLRYCLAMKTGV